MSRAAKTDEADMHADYYFDAQVFQETDLKALKDVASKRGDDGKKILEETYDRAFPFQVLPFPFSVVLRY